MVQPNIRENIGDGKRGKIGGCLQKGNKKETTGEAKGSGIKRPLLLRLRDHFHLPFYSMLSYVNPFFLLSNTHIYTPLLNILSLLVFLPLKLNVSENYFLIFFVSLIWFFSSIFSNFLFNPSKANSRNIAFFTLSPL